MEGILEAADPDRNALASDESGRQVCDTFQKEPLQKETKKQRQFRHLCHNPHVAIFG